MIFAYGKLVLGNYHTPLTLVLLGHALSSNDIFDQILRLVRGTNASILHIQWEGLVDSGN